MKLLIVILAVGCLIIGYLIGNIIATRRRDKHWESQIENHRKDAIARSRAVLTGHFSEQLAPYLPDFPFKPTECKFIGKPIDFIVFNGLDEKNVTRVSFVEVKSGKSNLTSTEKTVKDSIVNGRVEWIDYRVPEDLK
jgi:predicted Holliday junction resolvase-like endonuclease